MNQTCSGTPRQYATGVLPPPLHGRLSPVCYVTGGIPSSTEIINAIYVQPPCLDLQSIGLAIWVLPYLLWCREWFADDLINPTDIGKLVFLALSDNQNVFDVFLPTTYHNQRSTVLSPCPSAPAHQTPP